MTGRLTRYRTRSAEVDAVQWTADNLDEVRKICPDARTADSGWTILVPIQPGHRPPGMPDHLRAHVGYYVLRGEGGRCLPIAPDAFERSYVPADPRGPSESPGVSPERPAEVDEPGRGAVWQVVHESASRALLGLASTEGADLERAAGAVASAAAEALARRGAVLLSEEDRGDLAFLREVAAALARPTMDVQWPEARLTRAAELLDRLRSPVP